MKLLNMTSSLLALAALALFSAGAQATVVNTLTSGPNTDILCQNNPHPSLVQNCWLGSTYGTGSSNDKILEAFENNVPGFKELSLLYKAESDPFGELGPLSGSYTTTFNKVGDEFDGATIHYDGGPAVDCSSTCFLLVKDGEFSPYAYLFNLALGWDPTAGPHGLPTLAGPPSWNGTMDLVLKNFWAGQGGSMSYAALYGNLSEVPVPAAFWLFGTALLGFIGLSRSTRV